MMEFPAHCDKCPALRACKYTFGAYYLTKSSGGIGCTVPFTQEQAARIEVELDRIEKMREEEAVQADIFVEKAEQDCPFVARTWVVTHRCQEYETTAKTERGAINCIRFKLYGTRPMSSLPPFTARPKACGNISASFAAKRLARLVG